MHKYIEVSTQKEFDACINAGNIAIVRSGRWIAWENSSVEARGNSSVEARGNSSVVARGNSSVMARGNSSVVAWENSSVVAKANVFIRLFSATKIVASASVAIMMHGEALSIEGGIRIAVKPISTPQEWCDFYGVITNDGVAILYKSLNPDFTSYHGTSYTPGTMPSAPDWDGGIVECGKGLHFSPTPRHALEFQSGNTFMACPVRLDEIAIHPKGNYPQKVKAPRVCAPCYQVDRNGKPI